MPRAVDLQLLTLALVAGASVGWVTVRVACRRWIDALALAVAILLAWLGDRWLVHAVPPDLVDGLGPWVVAALVAGAVGVGASRLPRTSTIGLPPVLLLALASLIGVWAGVPETSPALLLAGVLGGIGVVLRLAPSRVSPWAAVVIGVAPVVAAVAGAAGEAHAAVGGVLCSATLVVMAFGRELPSVPSRALAGATALQLVAALVAARQVAIIDDWATAMVAAAVVIALSAAAAALLRDAQGRPAS